jgi:hypothetical protein
MVRRHIGLDMHVIEPEPTGESARPSFRASYIPSYTSPDEFISKKIEILVNDLKIKLTAEDIAHLCALKTESEINNAVKRLINKYWE